MSERKIMLGRLAIVFTVAAWFSYMFVTIVEQFVEGRASSARLVIEAIVYLVVVTALTASAMAYLITRIGFFYRSRAHHRAPRAEIDHFFTESVPTVTVLVPSYQEEERVVRTTLLSAALQEHPLLRVVLLVDDPPNPTTPKAAAMLESRAPCRGGWLTSWPSHSGTRWRRWSTSRTCRPGTVNRRWTTCASWRGTTNGRPSGCAASGPARRWWTTPTPSSWSTCWARWPTTWR
ncbi:MAG: glycosyltransferase family 2 protein [Ilumatobacteraceae bacterium]